MAMIRNEIERRNAEKDLAYLRTELEERADADRDDAAHEVAEALRIKAADVEAAIREYDDLKAGRVPVAKAESLDGLGELLVKARISKGWSQADLARVLEMEPQQIQRYERNDWQKASLWRLQEAAEALELNMALRVKLAEQESSEDDALQDHNGESGEEPKTLAVAALSYDDKDSNRRPRSPRLPPASDVRIRRRLRPQRIGRLAQRGA